VEPPGGEWTWKGEPVENVETMPSIKTKFGVAETGTASVKAAFQELSAFINNSGLAEDEDKNEEDRVIRLGDWIDLEGGLTVEDHSADGGGFSSGDEGMHWDANITLNGAPQGKMCRLIVVGINPFKDLNGNGATPHVVFQLQNVPVVRQMNPTGSNAGGYPESEMRAYLTGEFLSGLKDAGVPEGVLWGPARVVSGKGDGAKTINDTLWLPTEREMVDDQNYSVADHETEKNQAWLPYYVDSAARKKVYKTNTDYPVVSTPTGQWYWEGSARAVDASSFSIVYITGGDANGYSASTLGGCVPAFCVK
jgi:hypothetical protein